MTLNFCSVRGVWSRQQKDGTDWDFPGQYHLFFIGSVLPVGGLLEIVGFLQDHILDLYGDHLLASTILSHIVPFVNAFLSLLSQVVPASTFPHIPRSGKKPVNPGSPPPRLPGFFAYIKSLSILSSLSISFAFVSSNRCTYILYVVLTFLCPNCSLIALMSTPASKHRVAYV